MAKAERERTSQERTGFGVSTQENLDYWARAARSHSHPDVDSAKPARDVYARLKAYTNRKD